MALMFSGWLRITLKLWSSSPLPNNLGVAAMKMISIKSVRGHEHTEKIYGAGLGAIKGRMKPGKSDIVNLNVDNS